MYRALLCTSYGKVVGASLSEPHGSEYYSDFFQWVLKAFSTALVLTGAHMLFTLHTGSCIS